MLRKFKPTQKPVYILNHPEMLSIIIALFSFLYRVSNENLNSKRREFQDSFFNIWQTYWIQKLAYNRTRKPVDSPFLFIEFQVVIKFIVQSLIPQSHMQKNQLRQILLTEEINIVILPSFIFPEINYRNGEKRKNWRR